MYWLRKFYGPTIFFAPETEEGVETPETEETEGDETEETEETEDEESEETEETEEEPEGDDDTGVAGNASANRRESRNARQARENRELRERTARLEGELNALKNTGKPADTEAARRTREEKLALMSPEERMAFEAKEETAALRNEARNTQFMVLDMSDKNSYDLLATRDPIAAKHKAEVEKLLGEMRKNGTTAPRETLLDYIIGRHARMAAQSKTGKKVIAKRKEEASARVNQSKSKPTSARGDTGGGGKGEETVAQMRERLLAREARGDTN